MTPPHVLSCLPSRAPPPPPLTCTCLLTPPYVVSCLPVRAPPHSPPTSQGAIYEMCRAVLSVLKSVWDWGQLVPTASTRAAGKTAFFPAIAKDVEITRSVLLLTGSASGVSKDVAKYLASLMTFEWLWKDDPSAQFQVGQPPPPLVPLPSFSNLPCCFVGSDVRGVAGMQAA